MLSMFCSHWPRILTHVGVVLNVQAKQKKQPKLVRWQSNFIFAFVDVCELQSICSIWYICLSLSFPQPSRLLWFAGCLLYRTRQGYSRVPIRTDRFCWELVKIRLCSMLLWILQEIMMAFNRFKKWWALFLYAQRCRCYRIFICTTLEIKVERLSLWI